MNVLFLDSEMLYDDLLPAGLRQIGCTVKTVTEVFNGQLDRALADFRPDFVLMLGWSYFPTTERREFIRKVLDLHQLPLIYWATEDPCWHEKWSVPVVESLKPDLVVTICRECVPRYDALGFRAACLPFGYNHELYRPVAPWPEYACDITVVATFYTDDFDKLNRKRSLLQLVSPLLDRDYDIQIWGNNWNLAPEYGMHLRDGVWKGYLNHRKAPAVYNSAKIVIGVQNEFNFASNLTMRTCEVLGSGGFLLSSRTLAIERLFQHRKHLVMSSSPEETLALVDYYLTHPKERARIAAAGQAEVRSRHTYAHRARELLDLFERRVKPYRLRPKAALPTIEESPGQPDHSVAGPVREYHGGGAHEGEDRTGSLGPEIPGGVRLKERVIRSIVGAWERLSSWLGSLWRRTPPRSPG